MRERERERDTLVLLQAVGLSNDERKSSEIDMKRKWHVLTPVLGQLFLFQIAYFMLLVLSVYSMCQFTFYVVSGWHIRFANVKQYWYCWFVKRSRKYAVQFLCTVCTTWYSSTLLAHSHWAVFISVWRLCAAS